MKRVALLPLLALPVTAAAPAAASAAVAQAQLAPLVSAQGDPISAQGALAISGGNGAAVSAPGGAASGQYVVTVRSGASPREHALSALPQGAVTHVFTHVLNGFSARLDAGQLDRLRHDPNVVKVAQAATVHTMSSPASVSVPASPSALVSASAFASASASARAFTPASAPGLASRSAPASSLASVPASTQFNPDWGLDRLDAASGLDGKYTYAHTGRGVTAYVIDTGIDPSVADFGGRASIAFDATGGNGKDCNGHGTHVAGSLGGTTYGVAKGVTLRAVRVLDCYGSGMDADVVAGMDWVAQHAQRPAVANMSLGGGKSATIDAAAKKLTGAGVFLAVAAGNNGTDACNGSPSGADNVLTVAASDRTDTSAGFTDTGRCVEVYAPGVAITSDWLNGTTRILSGTSMATPHVVGMAALYKEARGDTAQAAVTAWITSHAVRGAISGVPSGTPNLLLNTGGL